MISLRTQRVLLATALSLTSGALASCDADAPGKEVDRTENQSEEGESIKNEWQIAYTGDRTGEIAGTVTTHMSMDMSAKHTTLAAASHGSDAKMNASYHTPLDGPHTGPVSFIGFSMTLEDESTCRQRVQGEDPLGFLEVNVLADNDKAFQLEFSGEVDCDGDVLAVTGTFNRKK